MLRLHFKIPKTGAGVSAGLGRPAMGVDGQDYFFGK